MLEILTAVGEIERLVDQREVGNDVAEHADLQQWPVLPGRVVGMDPVESSIGTDAYRDQDLTAPALHPAQALADRLHLVIGVWISPAGSRWRMSRIRRSDSDYLGKTHLGPRQDVALTLGGDCHIQFVVGRLGKLGARIPGLGTGTSGQAGEP